MNLQDDPEAMFRTALPEAPPPAAFDLDRIVRDGYRVRRRQRAMVGGAAATGVAAIAAVLALSVLGLPGADEEASPPADSVEDTAMAGYPYAQSEVFGTEEERALLEENTEAAFGPLIEQVGGVVQEDIEPFSFRPRQSPGNYGQTWLRSYETSVSVDGGDDEEDTPLHVRALLPGGWTAEPGPVTEQLFPQHVISASGSPWNEDADWTDELETTDVDGGRTLTTVNHECAYEALLTYPDGSGLHAVWDMGCGEGAQEFAIAFEDFTEAVAAMPEVAFDTSELRPVEELVEVPTGWLYDAGWEESAQEAAEASADAARDMFQAEMPGSSLGEGTAEYLGSSNHGAVVERRYHASGVMEFADSGGEAPFNLNYTLPGGWVPGISDSADFGPELHRCLDSAVCESETEYDGTVWTFEELIEPQEVPEGASDPDEYTNHQLEVTRFDPDGWAAAISVQWTGSAPFEREDITDILGALPAPEYDASATPEIPEN
ncbi:hypothetical protein O1R50_18580 [Glycomyces luteolus]|uniref:Uncharacterized protein n=1 Tax=Glycomyces luteolus TaxID=2670330 RepID=A0A9X3PMV3_9ACTN|nr:hypothetical protein [Glycomyces luteolus]MDA1361640.1 hypothetical protein [Glycomyces luteolus]